MESEKNAVCMREFAGFKTWLYPPEEINRETANRAENEWKKKRPRRNSGVDDFVYDSLSVKNRAYATFSGTTNGAR